MKTNAIKAFYILFGVFVLSGCGKTLPISGLPIKVTPTDIAGGKGLDVYAHLRAENPDIPKLKGQSVLVVRAYDGSDPQKFNVEVVAQCSVSAEELYTAEVTTPAELIVPNYGEYSPIVSARCTHKGLSGQKSIDVYNVTSKRIGDSNPGVGLLGAIFTSVVLAARSTKDDVFEYRPLEVTMK